MKVSFKHLRPIAVVLGATAFAILSFPAKALAADPITGAWLGAGSTSYRPPSSDHREWGMGRDTGGLELRPSGLFLCRVSSNQLIGRFQFTGTDQNGHRRYAGQWFSWTISSPGVCAVLGPSGQYTASLQPGSDSFQDPRLQYGPDNMINIYEGSYPLDKGFPADVSIGFIRKSGASVLPPLPPPPPPPATTATAAAAAAATTATAAAAAAAAALAAMRPSSCRVKPPHLQVAGSTR